MATKKITFDPTAGVPVASNLTIYTGSDFKTTFTIVIPQMQHLIFILIVLLGLDLLRYKKVLV